MNAAALEAEFASRAIPCDSGLLLLTPDDAIAFVRRARDERIAILGVDGMFATATETVSPLEHIADYTAAVGRGDGCWRIAERFIVDRRELGLVFEVVLGENVSHAV